MRRTDRLFDLIQILRDGRLHRAQDIAERLEVSTRTVWRDMATLMASGLPVEGERGVGYILRPPITLPPIVPWWITLVATLFAIVVVKHLYGGLGQNPFNPAMAAFCALSARIA